MFQNPQPLPTLNNTCYNTITMKNKTTYKSNITAFVGRSEQSDLRHLTFCRGNLRQIAKNKRYSFSSFFLHSKPVKTAHKPRQELKQDHNTVKIQLCKKRHKTVSFKTEEITRFVGLSEQSDLRHLTFCRGNLRQIAKNKRYSFSSFFLHSKPVKTTHKPRQELKPDHNTVKIQLCKKRHKTVSFKTEEITRFVGRSKRSDLRQYIRQFNNSQKTDKNQAEQRLPFFFFFTFKKTDENNP